MIRINLLKKGSRRKSMSFPMPLIIGSGAVLIVALVAVFLVPHVFKPKKVAVAVVVPKPVPTVVQKKEPPVAPSSFVAQRQVEDVVTDVADTVDIARKDGKLLIPYSQMSFTEQINFESLFARAACEVLARAVPDDIGLRSLEIANFQTVYAVGLGSRKESVNAMFAAVKRERVEVLAPPYSFIRPNGTDGYRFAFTYKALWGIDLTDPFVDLSLSTLSENEDLPALITRFSALGKNSGVSLVPPTPVQTEVAQAGSFRRYSYHVTGTGSFVDFVAWIKALYDARIQCAFIKLSVGAKSRSLVSIDGIVIFTVRK